VPRPEEKRNGVDVQVPATHDSYWRYCGAVMSRLTCMLHKFRCCPVPSVIFLRCPLSRRGTDTEVSSRHSLAFGPTPRGVPVSRLPPGLTSRRALPPFPPRPYSRGEQQDEHCWAPRVSAGVMQSSMARKEGRHRELNVNQRGGLGLAANARDPLQAARHGAASPPTIDLVHLDWPPCGIRDGRGGVDG
jgi:hypothetical protein